jgi:hypothetical protein
MAAQKLQETSYLRAQQQVTPAGTIHGARFLRCRSAAPGPAKVLFEFFSSFLQAHSTGQYQ